jgi:hypothetical protein
MLRANGQNTRPAGGPPLLSAVGLACESSKLSGSVALLYTGEA